MYLHQYQAPAAPSEALVLLAVLCSNRAAAFMRLGLWEQEVSTTATTTNDNNNDENNNSNSTSTSTSISTSTSNIYIYIYISGPAGRRRCGAPPRGLAQGPRQTRRRPAGDAAVRGGLLSDISLARLKVLSSRLSILSS